MPPLLPFRSARRMEREIDEELRFHIEQRIRDNVAAGLSPAEAREEAVRRFGDMAAVRAACRSIARERLRAERRAQMLDELRQDVRFSLRSLVKRPGFTAVAVITLALGTGGATAVFSVVDGVLLRPLPYPESDRLAMLWGVEGGMKSGSNWASYPDFLDFEARTSAFEELALTGPPTSLAVTGSEGRPTQVTAAAVSHDLFQVLGVEPALGRGILPEDDRVGAQPVVVLGHGFWRGRFAGDRSALGRSLAVDGVERTVVGVMPPEFDFPGDVQLWVPAAPIFSEDQRGQHRVLPVARLRAGVPLELADRDVKAVAAQLEAEYPETNTNRGARIESLHDAVVGDVRPALLVLLGAVGVVLAIVCVNMASLMLARASGRGKELAIRTALGAGRSRLMRQALAESVLLALLGGLAGVGLAYGGVELLKALGPGELPRLDSVSVDARVLGFALIVSLGCGVLFGLAPALHVSEPELRDSLKEGGRGTTVGGRRPRLRQTLVVGEFAMAVVLVVGAGLLINSFLHIQGVDPGFREDDVLVVPISLPESRYTFQRWGEVVAFYDRLLERVRALPGVESAAAAHQHPLSGGWETSFGIPGVYQPPRGESPEARIRPVTPGYFRTVGVPLLEGRDFEPRDDSGAPGVVIINQSFARTFFGAESPIGHRLRKGKWWDELPREFEIVGVVADVKMDGLTAETPWAMYFPHAQQPFNQMNVVVRSAGDPRSLTASIREAVWQLDPSLPVEGITTLARIRNRSTAPQRFQMVLLGIFAAVALTLAAVGIYGVLGYAVAQRTGEIGIRKSLGARTLDVLRLVVGQGMRLAVLGLAIGLLGALALTRLMSSLLYEVSPDDPTTYGLVGALLALVALAACLVPALRASRVDPIVALRATSDE